MERPTAFSHRLRDQRPTDVKMILECDIVGHNKKTKHILI